MEIMDFVEKSMCVLQSMQFSARAVGNEHQPVRRTTLCAGSSGTSWFSLRGIHCARTAGSDGPWSRVSVQEDLCQGDVQLYHLISVLCLVLCTYIKNVANDVHLYAAPRAAPAMRATECARRPRLAIIRSEKVVTGHGGIAREKTNVACKE